MRQRYADRMTYAAIALAVALSAVVALVRAGAG